MARPHVGVLSGLVFIEHLGNENSAIVKCNSEEHFTALIFHRLSERGIELSISFLEYGESVCLKRADIGAEDEIVTVGIELIKVAGGQAQYTQQELVKLYYNSSVRLHFV